MPGSGGQVRTWFFAKALAELGEVTLVSLGGSGGGGHVGDGMVAKCERVIETGPLPQIRQQATRPWSRVRSWMRTIQVLAFPWRNHWKDFLGYNLQHGGKYSSAEPAERKWSKRFLGQLLRMEYRMASRLLRLPPLTVFLFQRNFEVVSPVLFDLLKKESFDLLWFEHSLMYPFAEVLREKMPGVLMVCNAHNVESILYARIARAADDLQEGEQAAIQARLLASMEKDAFGACDRVIVCSEQDGEVAKKLAPTCRIDVVGNGVDSSYFQRPLAATRSPLPTLLFTGGFGYGPNRDALHYFLRDILPLVHARRPECRFVFAGANADEAARDFGVSDARITWVSSPLDIRPCFHGAWVAVVPLRTGGGTRLKILEAMAMECAIVSTTLGAEGIPCENGRHLRIADSPQAFSSEVLHLLNDAESRLSQEQTALDWVREHYDWTVMERQIQHWMKESFPAHFSSGGQVDSCRKNGLIPPVLSTCSD